MGSIEKSTRYTKNDKKYRTQNQKSIDAWKMGKKWKEKYASDSKVKHIHFEFNRCRWNWGNPKSSRGMKESKGLSDRIASG